MSSELLTAHQLATLLGVPRQAIYNLRYFGSAPPAIKIGGRLRWRQDDVARWLEACRETNRG